MVTFLSFCCSYRGLFVPRTYPESRVYEGGLLVGRQRRRNPSEVLEPTCDAAWVLSIQGYGTLNDRRGRCK